MFESKQFIKKGSYVLIIHVKFKLRLGSGLGGEALK